MWPQWNEEINRGLVGFYLFIPGEGGPQGLTRSGWSGAHYVV